MDPAIHSLNGFSHLCTFLKRVSNRAKPCGSTAHKLESRFGLVFNADSPAALDAIEERFIPARLAFASDRSRVSGWASVAKNELVHDHAFRWEKCTA